ncbi:MAG: glycosyl hydrolase, partial [Bryobacteraceae bacterium]
GIKNLPFLSSEHLEMLKYAAEQCRKKGISLDVTMGTGWPYGGPWITPEFAARMIRIRESSEPLKPGEELVARFGDRNVVSCLTGMTVKRPSISAEGPVLDHYSRAALQRHVDTAGEKLWSAVKAPGIRSFWVDSLEVYNSNWTPGLLQEFEKRRGYDLKPLLPLLFGEATPEARQVRYDYWRTLSELATDNFVRPLQEWCHRKGVQLSGEPYGQPPVTLGSARYVDRVFGEHYEWRMFNASRWASSGAHLHGKNVVGAEAWTWLARPNRFGETLEQLKLASDMHFVSGINTLMGVAYGYTPESAGKPGWTSYNGPVLGHNQTWWPYFPLFSRYVQRVSYLLQQGRPVTDVALYLPVGDVFSRTPATASLNPYFGVRDLMNGKHSPEFGLEDALKGDTPVISTLINNGYSFDGIDSSTLPGAKIERGHLKMGLGDYRVVVLPGLVGIPPADLEKLAEFVHSGGCLIATKRLPEVLYGWKSYQADTYAFPYPVKVQQLFAHGRYGQGRTFFVKEEGEEYRQALFACLPPDLELEKGDHDVAFVHRQLPDRDFYFIANLGPEEKLLPMKFRARGSEIELWDPMTGSISSGWDGKLHLDPYGSMVARVSDIASPEARSRPQEEVRPVELNAAWTLQAGKRPAVQLERLGSWTEIADMLHFSGTATYSTEVNVDLPHVSRVELDLGDVREIADVVVNGVSAGVAWKRPYRVDVTSHLRRGRNSIQVKVTNLWINAVLGMPQPDYSALRAKFGERFPDPLEWKQFKPFPSGLFGPARLLIYSAGN